MTSMQPQPRTAADLFSGITEDARRFGMTVHTSIPGPDGGGLLLHSAPGGQGVILSTVDGWADSTAVPLSQDACRTLRDALTALLEARP